MEYYKNFPDFYENEFIKSIAGNTKWTVSGRTVPDPSIPPKIPIDMYSLMYEAKIKGAPHWSYPYLITLSELLQVLPHAANHTYYLESPVDKTVVLDIEPTCPKELTEEFLKMPYIYGEVSMSGKGYHLVFDLPEKIFNSYPIARKKKRWIGEKNQYEVHFAHYITFTRRMLPPSPNLIPFEPFFETLAAEQKETIQAKIPTVTIDPKTVPRYIALSNALKGVKLNKKPADYASMSQYECGYAARLLYVMEPTIEDMEKKYDHKYTVEEKAAIVYEILKQKIDHRPKHDQEREHMPWLLYVATDMAARQELQKEQNAQNQNAKGK